MRAGNLRHYVKIEQYAGTIDNYGGVIKTWAAVPGLSQVPAAFRSLRGQELFEAQAIHNAASVEFRFRYQSGLTNMIDEDMRIVYDGKYYNIISILPDMTMRRELVVTCERGLIYTDVDNMAEVVGLAPTTSLTPATEMSDYG